MHECMAQHRDSEKLRPWDDCQDVRERGVEFKGRSLHDGFGGSGEHLALMSLVLQDKEATVTALTVLAVFGNYGSLDHDGYPP